MSGRILFATGNEGKMREIRAVLTDPPWSVCSLREAGLSIGIEENGATFEENALIKARTVHAATGEWVLADDSGLEVDAMEGGPGVYSARFLGYETPYRVKNQAILDRLAGLPPRKRTARFRCVVAAVFPDGHEVLTEGTIEGVIAPEICGEEGFGYDPIFWLPDRGRTMAQLSMEEKNAISHRGTALRKMVPYLAEWLERGRRT